MAIFAGSIIIYCSRRHRFRKDRKPQAAINLYTACTQTLRSINHCESVINLKKETDAAIKTRSNVPMRIVHALSSELRAAFMEVDRSDELGILRPLAFR